MSSQLATVRPEQETINMWHEAIALDVQANAISQATAVTYRRGFSKFYSWLLANDIERVTSNVVKRWMGEQLAIAKPSAVNTWYSGVRRFYEWATGAGIMAVNPTVGVKGARRRGTSKRHLRDALTDSEVLRVLSQPDRSTVQGKRDYAMLALMAYCGLRSIELQRADLADLSTIDGLPVLRVQGKGSTDKDDKAVIYHPRAQEALYDWLGARGGAQGPLFTSLSDRSQDERLSSRAVRDLVKYMRAAGVVNGRKTLHSLRHSAISKVARVDLLKARQVARHASIDTTMIYVHEADRLDNPGEQYIDYKNGNGA